MSSWHQEFIHPSFGYQIQSTATLYQAQSPYQAIQVLQTPVFGRVLVLDGSFQCSEADEFLYHEPLVHGALFSTLAPQRVLILGGGDGGAAKECLKHRSVRELIHVEIDAQVIAVSRDWLQAIHQGVLSGQDRRYRGVIDDGHAYLAASTERFDSIILDLTDPVGPSEALYSTAFYALVASRLSPGGTMSLHIGSPFAQMERCMDILARLRQSFACVRPLVVNIPMSGGPWLMAVCGARAALVASEARIRETLLSPDLRWFTEATWEAAHVTPPYLAHTMVAA